MEPTVYADTRIPYTAFPCGSERFRGSMRLPERVEHIVRDFFGGVGFCPVCGGYLPLFFKAASKLVMIIVI